MNLQERSQVCISTLQVVAKSNAGKAYLATINRTIELIKDLLKEIEVKNG